MYLRGSKWNMTRRRGRPSNPWRILLLLTLIGAALYVNQVVVPATPPLFIPTPTPTRSPESLFNEAQELFNTGKLAQSIDAYQQAILADPDNTAIYIALARAQIYSWRYEEALESAERAIILNNNNPMAHALKAWALDNLSDYTLAEAAVRQALDLDPNNATAHAVYSQILINKINSGVGDIGGIEKAADESRLAMSLNPNLLESRRARGYVLWNTGNWAEAIQEYKAALEINDRLPDLHMALGYNYRNLGEHVLAVERFLQATALNPTDPVPPLEISRIYYTVGDFSQAVQYAEQAVKADPENPRWRGNLGLMYYKNAMAQNKMEEMKNAITQLSLAIHGGTTEDGIVVEGMPLNYGSVAEYYAVYGLALARSNHCAEAVPIFQTILSGIPDDEINTYNAEQGLLICQENLDASPPAAESTTEPEDDSGQ